MTIDYKQVNLVREIITSLFNWIKRLNIVCLILSLLIFVTAIVFFLIRKRIKLRNPVRLIYIIYILMVIVILWGFIIYLYYNSGTNSVQASAEVYSKFLKLKCFESL